MDKLFTLPSQLAGKSWAGFFLIATLFALPISSSGKSIFLALAVISVLLHPAYRDDLSLIFKQSWCKAAGALFLFALLACLWSSAAYSERLLVLEKYSKLLYLPFLVAGFANSLIRKYSVNAFLLATLITSLLAIAKFYGLVPFLNYDAEFVFRNHIITGFMVAFSGYLCLYLFACPNTGLQQVNRYVYLTMAGIYSYHLLFINGSRTGYFVYVLLIALLFVQLFSWKKAVIGVALVVASFALLYQTNTVFHEKVSLISTEWHYYHHNNKNSSIGFRLQFHKFAKKLFRKHPVAGNGTGSFTYYFRTLNPVPAWGVGHRLLEPHSQYWLIAAEFGTIGLILLGLFLSSLIYTIWRLSFMRVIGLGMLIPFLIGNFSDSLLFYSGSGYLFLLFMAICLSEQIENKKLNNRYLDYLGSRQNKLQGNYS